MQSIRQLHWYEYCFGFFNVLTVSNHVLKAVDQARLWRLPRDTDLHRLCPWSDVAQQVAEQDLGMIWASLKYASGSSSDLQPQLQGPVHRNPHRTGGGGGGKKTDYSNISYPITWWNNTNMTDVPEGSLLSQAAFSRRRPRRQRLRKQPLEHGGVLNHAAPHAARHTRHQRITSRSWIYPPWRTNHAGVLTRQSELIRPPICWDGRWVKSAIANFRLQLSSERTMREKRVNVGTKSVLGFGVCVCSQCFCS